MVFLRHIYIHSIFYLYFIYIHSCIFSLSCIFSFMYILMYNYLYTFMYIDVPRREKFFSVQGYSFHQNRKEIQYYNRQREEMKCALARSRLLRRMNCSRFCQKSWRPPVSSSSLQRCRRKKISH